jgi:hypothetical protein
VITRAEPRARLATLVNGELLAEGEILQDQDTTKFEDGNECRNKGSKARVIILTLMGPRAPVK